MSENTELLKQIHSSLCIRFGTQAPYEIGKIRAERVGFASIPTVTFDVSCRQEDVSSLVPILRQRMYGELAERGWTPDDVEFSPTVGGSYRGRMFVDQNEESESFGRKKKGVRLEFRWEMKKDLAAATFVGFGSFKSLPDKPR
jgi:hypothetical protein